MFLFYLGAILLRANSPPIQHRELHSTGKQSSIYFNTWVPCARIGCFYFTLVPFSFVDNFSGDGAKFALPVRATPCCLRHLLPCTTFKTSLRFFHKLLYCVIAVASLPHDTERVQPVVTFDARLQENPIEFTADFGESLLICEIKDHLDQP